ncbi:MAG: helix-turn-helix domain-containing protein [Chloroflexota bacterium]
MTQEIPLDYHDQGFRYKLYTPTPSLTPFVGCYWALQSAQQPLSQELMIPDGYVDIIFNYGNPYRRTELGGLHRSHWISKSHIVGKRTRSVVLDHTAHLNLVGIKLKPYGLWALTRLPSHDFAGQIVPIDAAMHALVPLEYQIYEACNESDKIQIIEQFLLQNLLPFAEHHRDIQYATQIVLQMRGNIRIKDLAATLNMSYRQLERSFQNLIGLSPKAFARVVRFKKMMQTIKRSQSLSYEHQYLDFGYYDQNHFIKEFKHFMGGTPSDYFNNQFHSQDVFFSLGIDNNVAAWLSGQND